MVESRAPLIGGRAMAHLPWLSESMRATQAAESRFRIAKPNSRPRSSLIVALDEAGLGYLRPLSEQEWSGARFRGVTGAGSGEVSLMGLDGTSSALSTELARTDVVVMVAHGGSDAAAARDVGEAAFARRIMTAGFVEDVTEHPAELQRTLRGMRPYVISLFVGFGDDALGDVLTAIRA